MKKGWWYRFLFLITVVVISGFMVMPTVLDFKEDTSFPVKSKINLGLDLQGGLYMVLGIDFKKVYMDEIRQYGRKMVEALKEEGVSGRVGDINKSDGTDPKITVHVQDITQMDKAHDKIKEYFAGVTRLTGQNETTLEYGLLRAIKDDIEKQAVNKSIEVIRNRIDDLGVTEPEIISQGSDRIVVQLPGLSDIERAKEMIGSTAKLEFAIVNDEVSPVSLSEWVKKAEDEGIKFESNKKGARFSVFLEKLNDFLKTDLPEGFHIRFQKEISPLTNEITNMFPFLVEKNIRLSGEDLQDARMRIDQQKNEPYVSLDFKSKGAKVFETITGESKGKRMAIIMDGNVYTAPQINERIAGGRAQINLGQGNYQQLIKEARKIALVLRNGALPIELEFEEQRIVGPSLGADSIKAAKYASLMGSAVVFLFILFYYRIAGMMAVATLGLNVMIVLACLVGVEATLTLPGIAGIALTIGMAVDANIIIYERIREEIRKGVNNYKAVENGFNQAFWTIVDANITTALAGFCLLNFGTGPIRGFAVTLLIGIVATVYSSYFVGRLLFEFYMHSVSGKEVSV